MILKPPRSPLQDIRSGNEIGQDFITTRSRKSSRRVSFAETIKVFQTEVPTEVKEEPKNTGLAVEEKVPFKQAKRTEDNQCEIIGMETLLRAPIQVQLQQPEDSDMEPIHEKKCGNDQTVIFSDENQMDLTASHTVMITKDLFSCPEMGKPSKIDTKSFLTNLKSHTEDVTMNKEFNLSTDPDTIADKCSFQSKTSTSSEKKVNFNDFIKRLKLEKSISSCTEGPDKENVFIAHVPSQGPNNDAFSLPKKYVFANAEENSLGVTRLFREQGDGKDITQCHRDNIQSTDPIARETLLRPAEGCDFTVYGNDFMDLTVNHTAQIFLPTNNVSGIENHIQSVTVDVTKGDYTTKNPGSKRICSNQQNVLCHDPSGNLEDKIDITRSHTGMTDTPPASQASNQSSVTLALAPESTCPGPVFQSDKTIFFSSCDDAMEMTKSLIPKGDDKNACVSNLTQMYSNPEKAISNLMDKTVYSEEDDMDITKSNTVAIHDQIIKLSPTNVQGSSVPNLENELLFQDQETVSENIKQNKSCSPVSYVTAGRLQQSLANPLSVPLSGNKSVVFSGEDMDLTKCCTVKIDSSDLGTQLPLTSANLLAPVKTKKPLSHSSRHSSGLEMWEEMEITKSHTVPIHLHDSALVTQRKLGPKNTQTETCIKDKKILELSSYPDNDILHSSVYKVDMTKSHTIDICDENLERKVALGNNGNAHFHKQSWLSNVKPITFSSEDDMERHTIDINTYALKSTLGQNSRLSDPLKKHVANTSLAFCHDKTVMFTEQQNMDLTTSHTAVIGCMSCPSIQESGDMVPQNIIFKPQSELQNNANLLSNSSVMDFVRNNTAVIQMGKPCKIDSKSFLTNLKSHTEDVTMNKEFNLSTDPETIADKCSFQCKTSTSSEKINFNDFIKRLKLEKSISSCTEGPDKENVFIAHVPSQGPNNDAFSLPKKYVFANAEENSLGVTRLFREQGDGKGITQCHRDNIQSTDPIARETLLRPAEGCDFTVYGNDFMDLTVNHTAQIFLPTNNVSGIENHIQSVTVDVTKGDYTTKNPGSKRICSNQQNVLCHDPSGNLEDKIDITRSHTGMTDTPPASQASNQSSVTLALAPESTCPGPVFQSDKTIFFSSCDDAMEMTKSLIPKGDDKNACVSNLTQMYSNPEKAISNLMDKTVYSEEDDMDITKSNTVAIHDQIIKLSPTNVQGSSVPNLENELLFQDQETVSENIKQNKSCSPVSYVTAGRLQQSLANPLSVPLSGNKSVVFSGEDMDLTKCCTVKTDSSDLGTQLPLTSANMLAPVKTKNPLSPNGRPTSQIVLQQIPFPLKEAFNSFSQDKGDLQSEKPFGNCQNSLSQPENLTVANTDVSPEYAHQSLLATKLVSTNSLLPYPSEKTIIFAPEQDNMDLTENHEVIIQTGNSEIPADEQQKQKYSEASMRYEKSPSLTLSCLNKKGMTEILGDSLEINKFHTIAGDKADLEEGASRATNKTVVFVNNQDELEITKPHTVLIDYQTMEKRQGRSHLTDSRSKSLGQAKMMFAPNDQTVFFSEECGNDLDLTKSHTTIINSQTVPQGDGHRSIPVDKTIMFTSNNDMELTKPVPCMTDKTVERSRLENAQLLDKPGGSKSMNELYSNKTVVFPVGDENNMEITSAPTKEINHKDVLKSEQDSCLAPLASASKTVLYRGEQDDMEITDLTKSHIFAMDCEANLQDAGTSRKMDKTVVFADNQNELEITKSHTVVINYQTMEKMQSSSHLMDSRRKSLGQTKMMFAPNDQTVFFSEEGENDLDLTKSHTTIINSQTVPQGDGHRSIPVDKTIMFTSNNDMELTKPVPCMTDKTVERSRLENAQLLDKPGGSKSMNELYSNKTVVFPAGDENNMEITSAPTKEINHKDVLKGEQDSCLAPLASASKTVLYRGEQDDMEITDLTKSHIFAMDCEANLQDAGTSRKMDKTVVFADNQNELEITKSHTVLIDYQTVEKRQGRSHLTDSRRKSLGQAKMMFAPNDQTVFFSEECGNDLDLTKSHTTIINSQTVPQGDGHRSIPVDKTIMFTSNNDMELTKPVPCMTDRTVERSRLENAQLLDKPGGSKSMNELYSNKTVVFPAGDENNMEITSAPTKEINHKDVLEGEQDSCRKMNKTVVFEDNQNELEITKSHTVVIDYQTMEKTQSMFPDKTKIDSFKRTSLVGALVPNNETVFLSDEDVNDRKVTKKQIDAIENRSFLQAEQHCALSFFPADKTIMFTGDQDAMEIDRSQSTVINEKTLEKVVDHMVKKEVCSFDSTVLLGKRTKSNSKTIPFKFPKHQVKAFIDDREQRQRSELFRDTVFVDSQPQLPTHSIPLPEKEQYSVNEVKLMQPEAENGNLEVAAGNLCALNYENKSKMLHDDRELIPASEKKPKQNIQISEWGTTMEIQVNSDSATEIDQLHATYSKLSDPVISSKVINTANIEQNLNTIKRSEIFSQSQISQIANLTEQLPKLGKQVGDSMDKSQMTETQNTEIGTNNTKNIEDEGKAYSSNGDATYSVPLKTVVKDTIKAKRYSLGIFLPKLPNKRNCSVTGMDALEHNSVDLTDLNSLEIQPVNKKNSDLMSALTESHLSPSQYINEEHLPLDPEESNSSESISIEAKGKAVVETCQQETQPPESIVKEIFSSQKRLLLQGEDDSIPSEKKVQKDETSLSDSAQALQAFDHHTEEYVDKNPCSSLMKTLNRTPPSCSSSSDSIKTDGTSMSYSMQQSSQMESQFLMDHICEENLKEKLHDGRITVREFLSLLQVHILIQKPRQSNLPANFATNVPSTPKDLMLSQYVYWPKIQIYKEDCQALHQKTEELKLHALKQDKLLVDVNRSLWEVMKGCSDEELKTFGAHLNKMKSRFAKKTKVFAHQGKAVLYSKLVQSAKDELEKLQTRMGKMDSVLTEVDTCLAALDLEIKNLDKNEEDIPVVEWDSEMLATEKELEQLQAEEEELKRNISELEIQREQVLAQVNSLQQEANRTKECLEKFSYSEWEIIEWSDSQAVFTFLYDSVELTITFGEPVDGLPFLSKACRRIIDINFKTLLHENKAPPSSLLVHRLIFQFIEDQGSWKNKCVTQHHVPKMLQEISLVVSRCKLLGEEIEFLNRWGPNYNLMNVDVNNTELKFLFSSSAAFAKFELTLTLSAHYPSVPLSFTIQNLIGNIAQDKIAAILSNVPLDNNYLKTAVRCIYQDLLQGPHLHH
ncbi:outer kinetochore KNL1 complex subunit KNL1 isoform X2 [Notamacropus eugenii]|uniref:outer kinetochore KNL1 complex subunit KNL1 isoform X2 n=1 Tax=Notamacropus eugenii TaxID=9315 RepID=UPI003B67DCB6